MKDAVIKAVTSSLAVIVCTALLVGAVLGLIFALGWFAGALGV